MEHLSTTDPGYNFYEKFLSFRILATLLEFLQRKICLISERLNTLYVTLYHIPSGDALRQIDAILIVSRTSNEKTTCKKTTCESFASVKFDFDPCFKIHLGHRIKKTFYLHYCWVLGFEPFLWSDYLHFFLIPGQEINTAAMMHLVYELSRGQRL